MIEGVALLSLYVLGHVWREGNVLVAACQCEKAVILLMHHAPAASYAHTYDGGLTEDREEALAPHKDVNFAGACMAFYKCVTVTVTHYKT